LLGIVETGFKLGMLVVGFIDGNVVGILLGLALFEGTQLGGFEGVALGNSVVGRIDGTIDEGRIDGNLEGVLEE
jgi:hypothetical protein